MEGRAVNPLQISEWGHTNFNDQNCSLRHDLGPGPGPQILAEMGFLEGEPAAGEKILASGDPKIRIYNGKSPPQAENFGESGPPKFRFTRGESPITGADFGDFSGGG